MTTRRAVAVAATIALAVSLVGGSAWAQSSAINGSIEGTVADGTGAILPGVAVTVSNVETGLSRSLVTDGFGHFRALTLPLGSYTVRAELAGFKAVERTGLSLSAGQTAVADISMEVGGVEEVVTVSGEAPIADPAKIDLGRTINSREIHDLPLLARNPYNFALIQPNVTGFENAEFGATRMNANGTQMRTNYQIDGGSATQKNRAGLRMFQPSEIMVKEVKVITSGFAPEFGQTTGMVFNAISPSGTNAFHGEASYRFRRQSFSSCPFLRDCDALGKPDTPIDGITGAIGGPIVKDKWHFYVGYEWRKNDLSSTRIITVTPQTSDELGLAPSAIGEGFVEAIQTVNMFIGKIDGQLNANNRVSARWSQFKNSTPENGGSGLNTREVAPDFQDKMDSIGLQLISTIGNNKLNELRFTYGKRDNPRVFSEPSLASPLPFRVNVSGVANFGKATNAPTLFVEEFFQIIDNFSVIKGNHNIKLGIDFQFITDERLNSLVPTWTFPSQAAYIAARDGVNPFSYTRLDQRIGIPDVEYKQRYYSFFIQDDWRVSPRLKVLYGLRYDLVQPPDGNPSAPAIETRDFHQDGNNFAPRVGLAWSLDDEGRTVLRASAGLMYEPPLGRIYEDALLNAGTDRLLSARVAPGDSAAPPYPNTLASLPPGVSPSSSIDTVSPDYDNQYAIMTNVQLERALTNDLSLSIGYVNSTGRSLPVAVSNNFLPSGDTLADGTPILDRDNRVRDEFAVVREIRSTGDSAYNAVTAQFNKRFSGGWQAQASYTWSDAKDHGLGGGMVVGSGDREGLSNPFDQEQDYGPTAFDTRHTFVMSAVIAPQSDNAILDNNQLGLIIQANSGLPFNVRSNRDLNNDGFTNDRPSGVTRNSETRGDVFNVDFRYSRFFPFAGSMRLEVFVEAKNIFNRASVANVNSVVTTDTQGNPVAALPSGVCEIGGSTSGCYRVTSTYQQRQFQLGAKFIF